MAEKTSSSSKVANSVMNMLSMSERDLNTWNSTLSTMKDHETVLLRVSETFRIGFTIIFTPGTISSGIARSEALLVTA